jgi:predicted ferric reductase
VTTTDIWLTARGAGLAALVLLTWSTVLGAFVSRGGAAQPDPKPARRYIVQYLHRSLAGLGLGVLVLHIGTVLADSYAHVGVTGALVPFTSGYRATAVALGTIAAYALVAVSVLGLARGRMASSPRAARAWRRLHGLAYVGWATAMLHGFAAGTDSSVPWVRQLYALCFVAVLGSVAVRLLSYRPAQLGDRFAGRVSARPPGAVR